ncbi:hypothetical protein [Microbulbifer sp. THAF38]|uniref:hypothetical protein n=1 Tax=Microbulbifer sp. THAF38 TaxID=2587856 RepID=UPI0012686CB7|nr:hypothetical protein [Microbulbifer sp. THAF38]QFT56583.1 hypothetical protein FIU95_18710 [Microbulbifer sp. THAF38]
MDSAVFSLLVIIVLLQATNIGCMLWRRFGPKLLLINYTVSGGVGDKAWTLHCSNFGRIRGPVSDVGLDYLVNEFVSRMKEDYSDINGYSLNGVTILDVAVPLPKEESN